MISYRGPRSNWYPAGIRPLDDAATANDLSWHWLWSSAARQLILDLSADSRLEIFSAGYGWGLREPGDRMRAVLLHPSGLDRATGDLAITIAGSRSSAVPRHNTSYMDYLAAVKRAVADQLA